MNQILNIFRKDTRRFWPEITLSLAITTALIFLYPLRWSGLPATRWGEDNTRTGGMALLGYGLIALIVISWMILIARIVHAEALVGDRQSWLTRPYEWKKLFAAKLLFLLAFLYLPLVGAQLVLLAAAGLNPLASIPELLFNLLIMTGFVVVPLIAIAAVTPDFFRMAFTLLIILLVGGAIIVALSMHSSGGSGSSLQAILFFLLLANQSSFSHATTSGSDHLELYFALSLLSVCGVVIVLQYALRPTRLSRQILLGLPILLAAIVLGVAHLASSGQALDRIYPLLAAQAQEPIHFSYGPDDRHPFYVSRGNSPVGIRIPIRVSGVAEGSAVFVDSERVAIQAADGFTWNSEVKDYYPQHFVPTGDRTAAGFFIPRAVYDKLKSTPVKVRLTFSLTHLQAINSIHIPMPTHDVAIPGFGVCGPRVRGSAWQVCRFAFRDPQLTYVSADWSNTPCSAPQTELEQVRGDPWMGVLNSRPTKFGIAPITFGDVAFTPDLNNATGGKYLCSDAPITLTQYKLAGRMQTSLILADFQLPED